jgi:hypothetical protein
MVAKIWTRGQRTEYWASCHSVDPFRMLGFSSLDSDIFSSSSSNLSLYLESILWISPASCFHITFFNWNPSQHDRWPETSRSWHTFRRQWVMVSGCPCGSATLDKGPLPRSCSFPTDIHQGISSRCLKQMRQYSVVKASFMITGAPLGQRYSSW